MTCHDVPTPGTVGILLPDGTAVELTWMDAYALGTGMAKSALAVAFMLGADSHVIDRVMADAHHQQLTACWHIHHPHRETS